LTNWQQSIESDASRYKTSHDLTEYIFQGKRAAEQVIRARRLDSVLLINLCFDEVEGLSLGGG